MTKKAPPQEDDNLSVHDLLETTHIPSGLIQPLIDDTIQAYGKWVDVIEQFVENQPTWADLEPVQQFSLVIMYASSIETFLHRVPAMTVAPLTDTIQ